MASNENQWLAMRNYLPAVIFVFSLLIVAGCADSGLKVVEVEGLVTYQNQPVTRGKVIFTPSGPSRIGAPRPASGKITEQGSYTMRAFGDRMGIEPGEYQVAIQSYSGTFISGNVVYLVPEKYAHPSSSGLIATIPSNTDGTFEINFSIP